MGFSIRAPMRPGRRQAAGNVMIMGGSVLPPAITVAVDGLDATITNTGGAAASVDWGDGTVNASLTHTYATQGVWEVTATNAAGSSVATAILSGFWATGRTAYCYTDTGGTVPASTGDAVAVEKSPNSGLASLTQTDPTKRPLTQTGGLQFDTVDDFQLFTGVALTGDFTAYFTGTLVASTTYVPFGSSATDATLLRFGDDRLYLVNNAGAAQTVTNNAAGLKGFRIRRSSGTVYVKTTGVAETGGAALTGTVTLGTTGRRILSGQQNGSASQRYLSRLLFNRDLSAGERTLMDSYLLAVDGVAP